MNRVLDFIVNHGLMILIQITGSIFLLTLIAGYTKGMIITIAIALGLFAIHQFYFRNKGPKKDKAISRSDL